jgi:hypothetical protein
MAFDSEAVYKAYVQGSIVVATTCWFPQTPVMDMFLYKGAKVIAGDGENYGSGRAPWIVGAQHLAHYVIKELRAGYGPISALARAKVDVKFSLRRFLYKKATEDALKFEVYGA